MSAGLGAAPQESWVTQDELRRLGTIPTARVALSIAAAWVALLACLECALRAHRLWMDVAGVLVNGYLFAVLAYWAHEATHFSLSRDRHRNDLVADLCLAGPVGVSVAQHRWQHQRHHQHLNDPAHELDESAWICLRGPLLAVQTALHLAGWHAVRTILRYQGARRDPRKSDLPSRSAVSAIAFVTWNGAVFALCALQGQWWMYFVLWVLPLFGPSVAIGNFGNIAMHQPDSGHCGLGEARLAPITRVIRAGWLERTLLAPVGFHYHFEHHRFPGIPAHQLPELHRLLEARGRFREDDIVHADGYLRTLWQLSRPVGAVAAPASRDGLVLARNSGAPGG